MQPLTSLSMRPLDGGDIRLVLYGMVVRHADMQLRGPNDAPLSRRLISKKTWK